MGSSRLMIRMISSRVIAPWNPNSNRTSGPTSCSHRLITSPRPLDEMPISCAGTDTPDPGSSGICTKADAQKAAARALELVRAFEEAGWLEECRTGDSTNVALLCAAEAVAEGSDASVLVTTLLGTAAEAGAAAAAWALPTSAAAPDGMGGCSGVGTGSETGSSCGCQMACRRIDVFASGT